MKHSILFFFGVLITTIATAQQRFTLTGIITDTEGEPLIGATVFIHETKKGTATDIHGQFTITDLKPGSYHLHFSYVGYHALTQTAIIKDRNSQLRIQLEESVNELHEIVIESNPLKLSQRENSVLIESVDENFIKKNTGTTLMHSLAQLPGVNYINMGVGVSKPVIRGLSHNRVVVADNGIKQEGQQWGSDHGLEIDQFNVEQMDILKGPASLAYGSDGLGGVIIIKHPNSLPKGKHQAKVQLLAKTNNDTYGLTAQAKGNHKGLSYRLRLTGLDYGDYKVPAQTFEYNRFILPIEHQRLKNTAGNERHLSATVGINRNWGYSHLTVSNFHQNTGIFSGAVGIPRAYQLDHDGDFKNIDLPAQEINHFKVISNSNIMIGKNWLEVDLGYQNNLRQERSYPHAHGRPVDSTNVDALELTLQTFTANARYFVNQHEEFETIFGFQTAYQQNRTGGFEFLIPAYHKYEAGLFSIFKYHASDRWVFNGGLRLDMAHIDAEETTYPFWYRSEYIADVQRNPAVKRDFFNYSAGIGLAFIPDPYWSYKLNLGKTFRIPSPPELTANGIHHGTFRFEKGNADLKAEEGYQLDAGIFYERSQWMISTSLFANYFQNYIYLSPNGRFPREEIDGELYPYPESGQEYAYKQAPAMHWGGEVNVQYKPTSRLKLYASGEYVWIQNTKTQLPLPFTPPYSIKLDAEYHLPIQTAILSGAFLKTNYSIYGSQNRVDQNEPTTKGYELLNASMGLEFGRKGFMELLFQAQNITDRLYLNHLSKYRILNLPEPGRNFVITAIFKLTGSSHQKEG
ncbi:TonB-dependent receptor [Rapidithrix thailandica]|uniref:TonB-dependent receptor n=1 Tax=Rapidithrix thailandica TaxID=413964 RepID=A0AAW9S0G8_9BACT